MSTAIGIDLGGTKIAAGVVDETGRIVRITEIPTQVKRPEDLDEAVTRLLSELDEPNAVGLGIGAAGIINYASGRYLYGPNTGLRELDMSDRLSKLAGMDVKVDNDANCAAWAEHRFGCGVDTSHFLFVTLGTGVGGGIVVNGQPLRGSHGGAAEIGHMLVDPNGPDCGCGRKGCWEQFVSGSAIERMGREIVKMKPTSAIAAAAKGDPGALTGQMVTAAAREGDEDAIRIVREVAHWIGEGCGSLVNIFEPEVIGIGGGMVSDWDLFADHARTSMAQRMEAPEHRPVPELKPAHLGPHAGVVGAALLVFDGV